MNSARFYDFSIDRLRCVLQWREQPVPINRKTFDLLLYLIDHRDRLVTKDELLENLWPDQFVEASNLTQHVFLLRKALSAQGGDQKIIQTVSRRGYRFTAPLDEDEAPAERMVLSATESITRVNFEEEDDADRDGSGSKETISEGVTSDSTIRRSLDTTDTTDAKVRNGSSQYLTERRRPPIQRAVHPVTPLGQWVALCGFVLLLTAGVFFALRWKDRMRVGGYQRITNDGRSKELGNTTATIVEDGNSLYFNEVSGERSILAQVPMEGGEVSYEPTPAVNVHLVGLRAAGRRALLLGSNWLVNVDQPLLSKDLSTGKVSSVFDIHAQDASWSPDGKNLAYAQLNNLYVRSTDGKTALVASVNGVVYWPRWSPDGRVIRFSENYQGFHDRLWQVDSAGGDLHELFADQSDREHMCCGTWTSSGRSFVYLSIQTNNSRIQIRSEDKGWWNKWAGQSIDISAAPLDLWKAPIPSPDGKHVFAIGEQLHGQLVRFNPVTRRPEPFLRGLSAEGLSFSPDHENIVWTAYPEGTLWRSSADGSGRVQLTQAPLLARFPHWSPDGSTIVFTAARPGSDWQLYTVPGNGGEIKPLVPESRGQGVATWSPDGEALAFGHLLDAADARKHSFDIEVFRVGDHSATLIPGSTGLWTARWSPDGRFISAITEDRQTLRLYDLRTGTWSDLAHANVNDVVWSPDSKSLFFDTGEGADPALYRVTLSDRKLEVWASLKDFRRAGFFGNGMGITPDGWPVLLEDTSIQDLYSISINLP